MSGPMANGRWLSPDLGAPGRRRSGYRAARCALAVQIRRRFPIDRSQCGQVHIFAVVKDVLGEPCILVSSARASGFLVLTHLPLQPFVVAGGCNSSHFAELNHRAAIVCHQHRVDALENIRGFQPYTDHMKSIKLRAVFLKQASIWVSSHTASGLL